MPPFSIHTVPYTHHTHTTLHTALPAHFAHCTHCTLHTHACTLGNSSQTCSFPCCSVLPNPGGRVFGIYICCCCEKKLSRRLGSRGILGANSLPCVVPSHNASMPYSISQAMPASPSPGCLLLTRSSATMYPPPGTRCGTVPPHWFKQLTHTDGHSADRPVPHCANLHIRCQLTPLWSA